jgi:hypothetical protein
LSRAAPDERPQTSRRSRTGRRIRLALLLLIVFGAPAVVSISLVTQEIGGEATSGEQPGGPVRGRVVDEHGRPLAHQPVALVLVSTDRVRSPGPATETDQQGAFALAAPPLAGSYLVVAGGTGTWQRDVHGLSFLDRRGKAIEPAPLELALRPGATLELTFHGGDGAPAGDGRYVIDGEERRGLLFGLVPYGLRREGALADGVLRLEGLPPMRARVSVAFDDGETVELELDVEPGANASTVVL